MVLSTLALFEWLEPEDVAHGPQRVQTAAPQHRTDMPMNTATSPHTVILSEAPALSLEAKNPNVILSEAKNLNEFALNVPQSRRSMKLKNRRNIFAPLEDPDKRPLEPQRATIAQPPTSPEPAPVIANPPPDALPPPQPFYSPAPLQPSGPTPAELAAGQAREEMKQYTFLGYLTKEGVRQAFLSKDQALYVVKEGEQFEQDIKLKSIGPMEVVLSKYIKQAKTTVEATLPLTPNEQDDI